MQPENLTASDVLDVLLCQVRPDKAEFLPGFFKAIPGGYGEGDKFLGVVVPDQRKTAKRFQCLPLTELAKLLASEWHECRLTAVYVLVLQYQKKSSSDAQRREIVDFYLNHLDGINNWDLVDSSAHKLLGAMALHSDLYLAKIRKLARSKQLWLERIAVIATLPFIKSDDFALTLELASRFLDHPHDLMHKAVGWMLREIGNRDVDVLRGFLEAHVAEMPRTMLRYSIEKLDRPERSLWLER